ncbi:MAG: 50S ribosomal protein L24 [Nitrosopumilus sp.]|nr:50S ribosomal protein L24 [Nitrosopumilus sp.]MDH3385051.1 50S ribosomal protein L24 [Nitrosopumilus sp.]
MKPTKMRNKLIYSASHVTKSKQISSPLSKELQKKYTKKSIRVVEGDNIKIVRGEFKGVDGKIAKISVQKSSISIEGVKKEKTKGDKFDVFVHSSNVIVTGLNSDDKWRISKLEGKKPSPKKNENSKETIVEKTKKVDTEPVKKETKVEKIKQKDSEK